MVEKEILYCLGHFGLVSSYVVVSLCIGRGSRLACRVCLNRLVKSRLVLQLVICILL